MARMRRPFGARMVGCRNTHSWSDCFSPSLRSAQSSPNGTGGDGSEPSKSTSTSSTAPSWKTRPSPKGCRVANKPKAHHPTPEERDERIAIPLDPEEALRGLLAVKPEPEDDEQ